MKTKIFLLNDPEDSLSSPLKVSHKTVEPKTKILTEKRYKLQLASAKSHLFFSLSDRLKDSKGTVFYLFLRHVTFYIDLLTEHRGCSSNPADLANSVNTTKQFLHGLGSFCPVIRKTLFLAAAMNIHDKRSVHTRALRLEIPLVPHARLRC